MFRNSDRGIRPVANQGQFCLGGQGKKEQFNTTFIFAMLPMQISPSQMAGLLRSLSVDRRSWSADLFRLYPSHDSSGSANRRLCQPVNRN